MLWHLVLPWLDFSNHREVLLRRVAEGHQEPLHKFYGGVFKLSCRRTSGPNPRFTEGTQLIVDAF